MKKIRGIIAPATTPFKPNGTLDVNCAQKQFNWLRKNDCHGIAVGGSTGEGHTLTRDEFSDLLLIARETLGSEYPLLGGIIVNSTLEAIERGKIAKEKGADALQVTPVHYLFKPNDKAMLQHFSLICEYTDMPVIIYNVVPWSYLSTELLCKIMKEVKGVIGVKQSAGDLKLMADLLNNCQTDDLIFSAVDALLYPSFLLNAHGAIAAILSAMPNQCVNLWDAVKNKELDVAMNIHRDLLNLWNTFSLDNLPACIKYVQSIQGLPESSVRAPMPMPDNQVKKEIKTALNKIN